MTARRTTCSDPPRPAAVKPAVSATMLQLFAYYVSVLRGCDVDKPRNLAKSVTVDSATRLR